MSMASEFNFTRPPFVLVPYCPTKGIIGPDVLVEIYGRLKEEDLYSSVFHDNPGMNLLEFMNFFSHPTVALQALVVAGNDQVKDIAAIAWLSGLEGFADKQRAVASFCVFKDYQNPQLTGKMAEFMFDYWFNCLGLDIIVGMTPAANRLAVRFIKRVGFKEICRIPDYSALFGKTTDCVVSYMNKEQFQQSYGG